LTPDPTGARPVARVHVLGRAADPEAADVRPAHLAAILTAKGAGIRLAHVAHPRYAGGRCKDRNDALQQKGPVPGAFRVAGAGFEPATSGL